MHRSEFELVKLKLITAQCSHLSRSLCKAPSPSGESTPPPMSWGATCLLPSTLWQTWSVSHCCIVSRLLRATSHSSFVFNVQIHLYADVLLPSSESVQLYPSWRKGCASMFSGGADAGSVSPAPMLRTQLITRFESMQSSLGLSCSIPVASLTLLDWTLAHFK